MAFPLNAGGKRVGQALPINGLLPDTGLLLVRVLGMSVPGLWVLFGEFGCLARVA